MFVTAVCFIYRSLGMYISRAKFEETLLPIFLEIFLIDCAVFVKPRTTSSLSLFAYYKNVNISKLKKDIPKRKAPFFFTLEKLFKYAAIIFFTS